MQIRKVKSEELAEIYKLVSSVGSLDLHHPYTYWVIFSSTPNLFLVAEQDGEIIGFVCGLGTYGNSETSFLWQIGVVPDLQCQGIGRALLDSFTAELKKMKKRTVIYTITDENMASNTLFSSYWDSQNIAYANIGETGEPISSMKSEIIFSADLS